MATITVMNVTVGILNRRVSSSVGVATAPAGTGVWPRDGLGMATAAETAARQATAEKLATNMCAFKHTSLRRRTLRGPRT